jgi:alpha-amylase
MTTTTTGKYVANPGGGVMMPFTGMYLLAETGGEVSTKVTAWSNAGIGSIWLPPVSKAQNGPFSMGYDPTDYFDFGNYNQMEL